MRRLENDVVHKICVMIEEKETIETISKKLNVSSQVISGIRTGKIHRDISCQYNISSNKLPDSIVHEICILSEEGMRTSEISRKLNIHMSRISGIRCGRQYRRISSQYNLPRTRNKKLEETTVHEVCRLLESGKTNTEIYEITGVSKDAVSNIRNGKTFTYITKDYNLKSSFIDPDTVHMMCQMMEDGKTNKEIAEKTNVQRCAISALRCGRMYSEISKNYNIDKLLNREYIDTEVIEKACQMMQDGYKNKDIVIACDMNKQTVSDLRNGRTHIDISKKYIIPRRTRKMDIDEEEIHNVCRMIDAGYKNKEIYKASNLSQSTIDKIKYSNAYISITGQYNFKNK